MDPRKYVTLLADVVKGQGKKYEDLTPEEQVKLIEIIPEIHNYVRDKVKETLDLKND